MSKANPIRRERYSQNSDGDFYVEKDQCLQCMAPENEAPGLMGFDKKEAHCYFRKQPSTRTEIDQAIAAVSVSEIQGLRYAGNDEYVLRRLRELGARDCCDALAGDEDTAPNADNVSRLQALLHKLLKWRTH